MNLTSNVCWAAFEASMLGTVDKLYGLQLRLRDRDSERVLGQAIRARRSILATYVLWSRLDEREQAEPALADLRQFGHCILADRLHADAKPIRYASDTRLAERASDVALLAMLWKVADALDRIESVAS